MKKKTRYYAAATLAIAGLIGSAGCIAAAGESTEEEVGEAEQALGELGCGTVTSDGSITDPSSCGDYSYLASPDTSYDHGADCPGQFVVGLGDTHSISYDYSGWADTLPSTQSTCQASHWEIAYYRKPILGSWSVVGTAKYHGVWYNTFPAGCRFEIDTGYSVPDFGNESYVTHRMAGRAYTVTCSPGCVETPKKIKLGRTAGPC